MSKMSSLICIAIFLILQLVDCQAFSIGLGETRASFMRYSKNISFRPLGPHALSTTRISHRSLSSSSSLNVIPEPGPCPECSDVNGYWDGSVNFVCIACGHEWPVDSVNDEGDADSDDGIVRDSNGNILESGDTVVLTKELGKGLKKGLKVTRIRVGDYGDGHDVEANIPQLGTFALKSQFLKKTK